MCAETRGGGSLCAGRALAPPQAVLGAVVDGAERKGVKMEHTEAYLKQKLAECQGREIIPPQVVTYHRFYRNYQNKISREKGKPLLKRILQCIASPLEHPPDSIIVASAITGITNTAA